MYKKIIFRKKDDIAETVSYLTENDWEFSYCQGKVLIVNVNDDEEFKFVTDHLNQMNYAYYAPDVFIDEHQSFHIRGLAGVWSIDVNQDMDYPGVDIEYYPDSDHLNHKPYPVSRPRVYIDEFPLRVLIWKDPSSEDASEEITFDEPYHF